MFNIGFNEEYKSIKAPEELYDRIINAESKPAAKRNVIPLGSVAAIAAAVAVIIVSSFMFGGNSTPSVYLGAQKLTGEVSVTEESNNGLSLARAVNEISCELRFDFDRETKINLSEGLLFDENGNIILEAEKEAVFSEELACVWTVPAANEDCTYEISLTDKTGTYFIKLEFDRQEGIWTACLTK